MLINDVLKFNTDSQINILETCIKDGLNLNNQLKKIGLSYENLRYLAIENPKTSTDDVNHHLENLENLRLNPNNIPAISFFSGAGGLDVGFEYAGYSNLASIEINELFCETLKLNFPNHLVVNGDIKEREIISNILTEKLKLTIPFEGVFHGGPPCQPFSIASNQRFNKNNENFKRKGFNDKEKGNLLEDYIWFIERFKPKVFIIENVPGLLELDKGEGLNIALKKLKNLGYTISDPKIINTAYYGVPQKRMRLIIVGSRTENQFIFPKPNLYQTSCFNVFQNDISNLNNHETRQHTANSVIRYMRLKFGERDQLGRVDRLNPYLPSKTVIAGGTKGGGRSHLHPYIPRTISVRECARLQTFPDNYIFAGSTARQFTQVGNAVPPLLGFKLAKEIYKQFFNK